MEATNWASVRQQFFRHLAQRLGFSFGLPLLSECHDRVLHAFGSHFTRPFKQILGGQILVQLDPVPTQEAEVTQRLSSALGAPRMAMCSELSFFGLDG